VRCLSFRGRFVVAVGGELDMHTVAPLRDGLDDVLERGGRNVLVDLTRVTFLESTTLAGSRRFLRGYGNLSRDGVSGHPYLRGRPFADPAQSLINVAVRPGTPVEAEIAVQRLVELTGILARRFAQLQHALDSRVAIEQAKGVMCERFSPDRRTPSTCCVAVRDRSECASTTPLP
jgi:hypothetical protein